MRTRRTRRSRLSESATSDYFDFDVRNRFVMSDLVRFSELYSYVCRAKLRRLEYYSSDHMNATGRIRFLLELVTGRLLVQNQTIIRHYRNEERMKNGVRLEYIRTDDNTVGTHVYNKYSICLQRFDIDFSL